MKISISHRFSGAVLCAVEAASWRLALEIAVKQRADLGGAYLRDADLRGADLRGADLGGADLRGADLRGADLRGANLGGADLGSAKVLAIAHLGLIDGWVTTLWHTDQGYRILAGCHTFTLNEAKAHYANRENRRGLYYLATEAWQVIARLQGWE